LEQVPSVVLADISKFSLMPDEKEVLFGLNTTFEIDKPFQIDRGRWIIQMHATNRGDEITNDYLRNRQSETLNSSSSSLNSIIFILAQLLLEMGQSVKAVNFLEKILPTTDDERANLYFMLADANISPYHSAEDALNEGIRLLTKSKELFDSLENKLGAADTLRRHADALNLIKQYDEATLMYRQAIDLYRKMPENIEHIASCYNGLADAYLGKRKYPEAKLYYMRALKKRLTHLSDQHPAIARSYYSLGYFYYHMGNNNENALDYLNKALERKNKIYPPDHPSIQCNKRLLQEVLAACKK
jgi:tetratricopeptide (TPR) repeat protein